MEEAGGEDKRLQRGARMKMSQFTETSESLSLRAPPLAAPGPHSFAQQKQQDASTSRKLRPFLSTHETPVSFHSHLAAAARRFFALGAPGSTERDLAASSSLLDAMEIFLRFPITWIWSSLVWKVKRGQSN